MMKKFQILFIFIFCLVLYSFSEELVTKKYYNCFFGGGKEVLYTRQGDIKDIEISYAKYDINMNRDYSLVKIKYYIKNSSSEALVVFSYPFIVANLKTTNGFESYDTKEFCYREFKIKVDGKESNFAIKNSNIRETILPFKSGDLFYKTQKDILEEKVVDMYYYTYSWYESDIYFKKKEKREIEIEYKVPHYFSEILLKNKYNSRDFEDPALEYISKEKNGETYLESERVFAYLFKNSYSEKEKRIKKVYIVLTANIADLEFLKILPISYKKRGNKFYWSYRDFGAKEEDNILVKILPAYSSNTINPLLFDFTPVRKQDGLLSFFELSNKSNEILVTYKNDKPNEKAIVSGIKIFTEPIFSRSELRDINRPLEILVEFSNSHDFSNSIKKIKSISFKNFKKGIVKKSSLVIYEGEPIECKYIKIKVLRFSESSEVLRISDIVFTK